MPRRGTLPRAIRKRTHVGCGQWLLPTVSCAPPCASASRTRSPGPSRSAFNPILVRHLGSFAARLKTPTPAHRGCKRLHHEPTPGRRNMASCRCEAWRPFYQHALPAFCIAHTLIAPPRDCDRTSANPTRRKHRSPKKRPWCTCLQAHRAPRQPQGELAAREYRQLNVS